MRIHTYCIHPVWPGEESTKVSYCDGCLLNSEKGNEIKELIQFGEAIEYKKNGNTNCDVCHKKE